MSSPDAFFASMSTLHTTELASAPFRVLSGPSEGKRLRALWACL